MEVQNEPVNIAPVMAEPKRGMSNFWKIFISVAATIVIIGGGVYYYMQMQIDSIRSDNQTQIDNLNKQIKSLQSASTTADTTSDDASATTDETADWKTYANDTYGFSFKYPNDWAQSKIDEFTVNGLKGIRFDIDGTDKTQSPRFSFWVNADGFGIEDTNFDYKAQVNGTKLSLVNYSDIAGLVTNSIPLDEVVGPKQTEVGTTQFTKGADTYVISTRFNTGTNDYRKTFYQILSTFQFTK